ncbi:MAG TPA: S4 domain-containing protein [Casimicrobiaceae bacterium]|nr:S4 domain-containing protein [Casimicrobiaceae bacterium]
MREAADGGSKPRRPRLDKWLWAARFYKTRSLAAQAITTGQVRIDGGRIKPAHEVKPGQRVTVRRAGLEWDVVVTAMSDRRGSAAAAALLYTEAPEAVAAREDEILRRRAAMAVAPKWPGRPTKRERRKLRELLGDLG